MHEQLVLLNSILFYSQQEDTMHHSIQLQVMLLLSRFFFHCICITAAKGMGKNLKDKINVLFKDFCILVFISCSSNGIDYKTTLKENNWTLKYPTIHNRQIIQFIANILMNFRPFR